MSEPVGGRELDEAVYERCLGYEGLYYEERVGDLLGWPPDAPSHKATYLKKVEPVSTDDAEALRIVRPWLNAQGYEIEVTWLPTGVVQVYVPMQDLESDFYSDGPESFAAKLCRAALAVSARKEARDA